MVINKKKSVLAFACFVILGTTSSFAAGRDDNSFIPVGDTAKPPIGWVQFCYDLPQECLAYTNAPRDVVLTRQSLRDLERINAVVNEKIRPVTDMDQFGTVEHWSYPAQDIGDCEDYVLLKRKMLIEAGWPREALLITVVRDKKGDGHAVLSVKTDKGEYILDNQEDRVLHWAQTGYRYIKRQSQWAENEWVLLGDSRPQEPTTASR